MTYRYWKFGICLLAICSFLNVYAEPLCCNHSFCSSSSLPAIDPRATVLNNLAPFNAIDANGPIDVQIFGGASRQQVALMDPRATRAEVRCGTLFLGEGTRPLTRERLSVKVYITCDLKQLNLSHSANVAGECIQSRCLSIFDDSCGNLCLRGHIALSSLISTGSGDVDLEWVDSNALEIIANNTGSIHLAGRANQVYAQLADAVHLDTQYLRVKSTWVKAGGIAQIETMSSGSLNAFASDAATVHYHGVPKFSYINTEDEANSFRW